MRTANEQLERQVEEDPMSVNVEHVEDPDAEHIEMVRERSSLRAVSS